MTGSHRLAVEKYNSGFTLVELAMVLLIVGLLLGGLVPTISSQIEQQRINETRKQLDEIKQALTGFAVANGRLPCPASSTSNGQESPMGGGNCTHFYNGFVPGATLGLVSTGSAGFFAVDAWGNNIRYAVTAWNGTSPTVNNVFTTANGMNIRGIGNLSPNLLICSTATGITTSNCGTGNINGLVSTPGVPAVIFSTGKNGGSGGTGIDEAANLNNDQSFVSHPPTAGNNEFDDIVIWLSPNILINRMVSAGRLP